MGSRAKGERQLAGQQVYTVCARGCSDGRCVCMDHAECLSKLVMTAASEKQKLKVKAESCQISLNFYFIICTHFICRGLGGVTTGPLLPSYVP